MNFFIMVSLFLSAALGVFRGIDLALLTDAETGLCIVGSVWLRYGALAVAVLADTACIILTEDSPLDPEAKAKAEAQGVAILRSGENAYHLAVALGKLLDHSDSSPSDP